MLKMVKSAGYQTELSELQTLDDVSDESVQTVLKESYFEDIYSFLSKEIVTKKSRSILIDNGSKKAADALQKYEEQLKMSEDAARQDKAEWEKKVKENLDALNNFIAQSKKEIDKSPLSNEKEELSKELADDLVEFTLNKDFISRVAGVIAQAAINKKWKIYWTSEDYREEIMKETAPEIVSLT